MSRIKDGNKSVRGGRVDLKTFTAYSNYWDAKDITDVGVWPYILQPVGH